MNTFDCFRSNGRQRASLRTYADEEVNVALVLGIQKKKKVFLHGEMGL